MIPRSIGLGAVFLAIGFISGCSPSLSDSSVCRSMGFFVSQAACTSATQGACQMTQLQSQSTSRNVICWKSGTQEGLNSPTPTPSPTASPGNTGTTGSACTGLTIPWSLGAWIPAQCGPGVTSLSRSVTCNHSCPCNSPNPPPASVTQCQPDLYQNQHYAQQCTEAGGVVNWLNNVARICIFNSSACPSGWESYKTNQIPWTRTAMASAVNHTNCIGGRETVWTGFHNLGPTAVESKDYCSSRNCARCLNWAKVYASVVSVGCY